MIKTYEKGSEIQVEPKEIDTDKVNINFQHPLISVIIPVYNVEKYVCQCIESVLNQTLKEIEIIIIDDGSIDNSYEVVKSKYGNCKNIFLEKNKRNLGQGETRNKGIKMARGKYIYFIDSDDVILPKMLEALYNKAEVCQADIVHMSGWYRSVDENFDLTKIKAKVIRDKEYHQESVQFPSDVSDRIKEYFVKRKKIISACVNLFRRDLLVDNDIFFPDMIYEDNPFIFACYINTDRIFTIPSIYYVYRNRKGSTTTDVSYGRLTKSINAIIVGNRYIADKANAKISEDLIYRSQVSFFYEVWPAIAMFYNGEYNIPIGTLEAVNKALKPYFEKDACFVSILLHQAATLARKK